MIIELKQVRLRPPEPEDREPFYSFLNDPEVTAGLVGFRPALARKNIDEWIEAHRRNPSTIVWTIADRETDECLGHAGLYEIDLRMRRGTFGICVGDRQRWGKGIGREVLEGIVRYGFEEQGLDQIRLTVLETNQRAKLLYEKFGFHLDGLLRREQYRKGKYVDLFLMSLLKEEWLRENAQPDESE